MNETISEMVSLRDKALKTFREIKSQGHGEHYKSLWNLINKAIVRKKEKAFLEFTIRN